MEIGKIRRSNCREGKGYLSRIHPRLFRTPGFTYPCSFFFSLFFFFSTKISHFDNRPTIGETMGEGRGGLSTDNRPTDNCRPVDRHFHRAIIGLSDLFDPLAFTRQSLVLRSMHRAIIRVNVTQKVTTALGFIPSCIRSNARFG